MTSANITTITLADAAEISIIMTRDKVYTTVLKWFRDTPTANLVLPDGAQVNSDFLQLTYITNRPRKLLIELNGQFMLVLTDPQRAVVKDKELVLTGFAQVLFDWQEGSDPAARAKVFKYGNVRFLPAVVQTATAPNPA